MYTGDTMTNKIIITTRSRSAIVSRVVVDDVSNDNDDGDGGILALGVLCFLKNDDNIFELTFCFSVFYFFLHVLCARLLSWRVE